MSDRLPNIIDLTRVSTQGADYVGHFSLSGMPRLADVLTHTQGDCELDGAIEYNASRTKGERWSVVGSIKTTLSLQCQRCLDDMALEVDAPLNVLVVQAQYTPSEDTEIPVFELDDQGQLDLNALVEEELLLHIPLVAKHDSIEACNQDMLGRATEYVLEPEAEIKQNPFAVLQQLKK